MSKEVEKKGLGWFKGNRASTDSTEVWENIIAEKETAAAQVIEEETVQEESPTEVVESANKNILSKENQDKLSLDVIVAVENLLKDRQLVRIKLSDLAKRLIEANETISRYKQDIENRDQLLNEKNKEVQTLENSLTNKQMSYDQLLEDYKEFQLNSNTEYEKVTSQLETEQNKYNQLNEEFTASKFDHMQKVNELEEKIRSMEAENKKYATNYQQIVEEKNQLMKTINEFTERMSFSFTPKSNTTNSPEQE
jgi:chromosome segregation ATPase